MNGYVEAGYSVVLTTLAVYAATLVRREHLARRRLEGTTAGPAVAEPPMESGSIGSPPGQDPEPQAP